MDAFLVFLVGACSLVLGVLSAQPNKEDCRPVAISAQLPDGSTYERKGKSCVFWEN